MKLKNILIVVKDIEVSKAFYRDLFGMHIVADFEGNTVLTGGLVLQERSRWELVEIIRENFDLRPAGIIKMLDLRRPIYRQTAAYGHFGRDDLNLPWERLDKVDVLNKYL